MIWGNWGNFSGDCVHLQLMHCILSHPLNLPDGSIKPRYTFKRTERSPGQFAVEDLPLSSITASYKAYQVSEQSIPLSPLIVASLPSDLEAGPSS